MTTPKYKIGDTIIFNHGYGAPDRTMVIEAVSANHGGNGHHRYWGGQYGVYEAQVLRARGK